MAIVESNVSAAVLTFSARLAELGDKTTAVGAVLFWTVNTTSLLFVPPAYVRTKRLPPRMNEPPSGTGEPPTLNGLVTVTGSLESLLTMTNESPLAGT